MIDWFRHASLRNKLVITNLLVAVPVLVLFAAASIFGQYYFQRQNKIDNLHSVADVLANNVRSAMLFQDKEAATTTLSSLAGLSFVSEGALFRTNGDSFANYQRETSGEPDSDVLSARALVAMDDEVLGYLTLTADTSILVESVRRSLYILLGVFVASLLLLTYLSNRLQRVISTPLVNLQRAMQEFGNDQHQAVTLTYEAIDEVGQLYAGFDQLMKEIQLKDQKVHEYQMHLSDLVEQRTAALRQSNESLQLAIEEAEQASRVKSEFIATMSHEIRTPLNGLLGMVNLMDEDQVTQIQRRRIQVMRTTGKSLLHIVNEILDFSKLQADKLVLDPTHFNLRNTLEDIAREFSQVSNDGIDVLLDIPEDLDLLIYADEARLRQIVYNLMSNAVKFTREGRVILKLQILASEHDNAVTLKLTVTDTGIGIAPEKLSSISSAFYQADSSTSREFGGTGLGLSISKNLLKLMDSELSINSEVNEGSCFGFVLTLDGTTQQRELTQYPDRKVAVAFGNTERQKLLVRQLNLLGIKPDQFLDLSAIDTPQKYTDILTDQPGTNQPGGTGLETRVIFLEQFTRTSCGIEQANLELPFVLDDLIYVLNANTNIPVQTRDLLPGKGFTVMVADDGAVNRETAAGFLSNDGFQLIFADDGAAAFKLYKSQPCDLILMDCSMPVIDGFAAAQMVRDHEHKFGLRRVPIVAMTAHDWTVVADRCQEADMDDYLSKPFDPGQLRRLLSKWLQLPEGDNLAPDKNIAGKHKLPDAEPEPEKNSDEVLVEELDEVLDEMFDEEFDEDVFQRIITAAPNSAGRLCLKLIEAYFDEIPGRLCSVNEAVAAKDISLLIRTAHVMKSSAGNLGLLKFQHWCNTVEAEGRLTSISQLQELQEITQSADAYLKSKHTFYSSDSQ